MKKFLFPAVLMTSALILASCSGGGGGTTPDVCATAGTCKVTITETGATGSYTVTGPGTTQSGAVGVKAIDKEGTWTVTPAAVTGFTVAPASAAVAISTSNKTPSVSFTYTAVSTVPTAPTIVSVSPANASLGNLTGQPIVITFSTPMNASVTQGAYISPTVVGSTALATNSSSFSWSAGNTVLTITPTTATAYALAPAAPIKYNYALTTAAISAAGLPLAAQFDGTYSTAVKYTANINSDPAKDLVATDLSVSNPVLTTGTATMAIGDNAANKQLAAYLTFDLGGLSLPAALTSDRIVKATLKLVPNVNTGTPYAVTPAGLSTAGEKLGLYSLVYSTLPFTGTPATLNPATKLASNLDSSVLATFSPSVLSAVQADWTARVAQGNLSQYQLRFPVSTNANGSIDQATIWSSTAAPVTKPKLTVEYLQDN